MELHLKSRKCVDLMAMGTLTKLGAPTLVFEDKRIYPPKSVWCIHRIQ